MNQKIKIIATDNIGRTESITLIVPKKTVKLLNDAYANVTPDGMSDNQLASTLGMASEDPRYFTMSQQRRLNDFYGTIYHRFYNYKLSLK